MENKSVEVRGVFRIYKRGINTFRNLFNDKNISPVKFRMKD